MNPLVLANVGLVEWISQPWHWAISGVAIATIVFLMTWMGRSFGVSSSFAVLCKVAGADKAAPFFQKYKLSDEGWRMAFVVGAIVGGFLAANFLASPEPVAISNETIEHLSGWGFEYPASTAEGAGMIPTDLHKAILSSCSSACRREVGFMVHKTTKVFLRA